YESINQNFFEPNLCYEPNSSSFDQYHSSQSSVTPQRSNEDVRLEMAKLIKNNRILLNNNDFPHEETITPSVLSIAWERISKIQYVFTKPEEILELMSKLLEYVRNIRVELAVYINSPCWNRPTFFFDNDEEDSILYKEYLEKSSDAITTILPTEEPEYSLSMGYEHLSTISKMKSDEVIESSAKNLEPIPSEYEVTSDDESECDVPVKDESSLIFSTFSNHIFDDNDDFTSSDDELLSNEDVPMEDFKVYSNSLFDEEEINFDKNLCLQAFFYEETDIFTGTDDLMPLGIESEDYDSEGDIHIFEELLGNETPPILENESSNFDHHDDPSFPRPPLEPPDVEIFFELDLGVLTTNVVKGISEHYVLIPNILPTLPTFDSLYPVYDTLLPFSSENEDKVFKPEPDDSVWRGHSSLGCPVSPFLSPLAKFKCGDRVRLKTRGIPKVLLQAWENFFEIQHAQPKDIHELLCKLIEDLKIISEELEEYINSPSWNRPTFYDDDDYSIQYKEYLENSSNAIAPVLPTEEHEYSLSMGDEHLNTISKTELDKIIKYSVKNLVPIPSESEVISNNESECDVPVNDESSPIFTTFLNPRFDCNDDFTSSDDESLSNEDVPKENFKICLGPLFDDEEIISSKIDPHHFAEFVLIESLLNRDTLIDSSLKFDYLLEEFSGKLAHINPIPLGIEEADFDLEEEIRLSLTPSPIPVEDSDSQMEEINLFLDTDDLMPPGSETNDYDSVGDIHSLKELLSNDTLPENESSKFDHHDDPSFPRPSPEPPDVEVFFKPDSGVLTTKVVKGISEHYVLMPNILSTLPTFDPIYPVYDTLL
nr:hypothetical protein [Tanacetum cinerariifolium]